jgi:hypothetical protein
VALTFFAIENAANNFGLIRNKKNWQTGAMENVEERFFTNNVRNGGNLWSAMSLRSFNNMVANEQMEILWVHRGA